MACACKGKKNGSFKVELPGGLKIVKKTEAEAVQYAAKHPGSKVIKTAA